MEFGLKHFIARKISAGIDEVSKFSFYHPRRPTISWPLKSESLEQQVCHLRLVSPTIRQLGTPSCPPPKTASLVARRRKSVYRSLKRINSGRKSKRKFISRNTENKENYNKVNNLNVTNPDFDVNETKFYVDNKEIIVPPNIKHNKVRDRSRVGTRMSLPMTASGSSSTTSPASSGASCSSSAVGSDTQSHGGSDGGSAGGNKTGSPAPSTRLSEDTSSILKAPSEVTLAGVEGVASRTEMEALRSELTQARQTIRVMHERERELKERLSDRSPHINQERPSCLRVTSPIRSSSTYCSSINNNNCNNGSKGTKFIHNHKFNANDLANSGKCNNKCPDKSISSPRREFVRSKSIVSLVDETPSQPSQPHSIKNWAHNYSKEYPKGFTNNKDQSSNFFPDNINSKIFVTNKHINNSNSLTCNNHSCERQQQEQQQLNPKSHYQQQIQDQQQQQMKRASAAVVASLNTRLENVALGEQRPSSLVRRYGNLYAQARLETLDALEELTEMRSASELKSKLVFSVVVLAFRSVSTTATALRQDVRRILQVPPTAGSSGGDAASFQSVIAVTSASPAGAHVAQSVVGLTKNNASPDVTALEAAMATVISANVDSHDLTRNVEDVCQQIWATLYDYPGLKNCEGLLRYIKECVRIAWGLVNQSPSYCIEYEARTFRPDLHVRFHTSDPTSDVVKTYLWPALREDVAGPCVHKGVVLT